MNTPGRTWLTQVANSRLVIFFLCALFTTAMIYNWVFPLGALLYTRGIDGNDCGQMVWNLWHTNESISSGRNPYHASEVYFPVGANLWHHTLAAGFFPVTFLVKHLSGDSPMYPLYAYRVVVLISFILILFLSFLFLRELGLSRWAAAAAAVGYSFSHFYMAHAMHINHLAGFLIPLTALLALRVYRVPGRNVILLTFVAGISVYFTEFSLYIYMAAGFFLAALFLFADERRRLVTAWRKTGVMNLAAAAVVFLLLFLPFFVNLVQDPAMKPPPEQSSIWSGNLAGFVIPDPQRTPLYGEAFRRLNERVTVGVGGFEMFLGFALLAFAMLALFKVSNRYLRISAVLCALFLVLSLGATLKVFGTETNAPLPYALLIHVPPFDSGRTPVRFIVMGLFFLMVVAAFGMFWLQRTVAARYGLHLSNAVMAIVFVWSAAEVYQPIARQQVFNPSPQLAKLTAGPVFELPLQAWDGYAALLQVFHHQPIATGYLARISQAQLDHAIELRRLTDRGPSFCEEIEKRGYRNVIITPSEYMEPHDAGTVTQLELEKCRLPVIDLRAQGTILPNHSNLVIREGREDPSFFPPLPLHRRVQFSSGEADKYLWYGWSGREIYSRWTDSGKTALVFSIDQQARRQSTLRLKIFGGPFLAPGRVDSQRVTIELNNFVIADWVLKSSEPALHEIELSVKDLADTNTLVFRLPDAASPRALGVSEDWRLLGFNVQWISID